MFKVTFATKLGISNEGSVVCPVCKNSSRRDVLTVGAAGHVPDALDLVECTSCGTMYFLGAEPVIGYDDASFEQEYWYNYVQSGAGISAMLEPLLAINGRCGGDLLDVGCGFGFVPDFWEKSGFGEAVGLETSFYGRVGREKLGVEIIHSYYNDANELAGRKFDYVYSSEVIEHVRDPRAFLMEISAALKPTGILVLTTPCADAIGPDSDVMTITAILSPGFHYFITRRAALESLLRSCGFAHVLVRSTGSRLFCWASHSPLPTIAESFSDWDIYLSYLEKLSHNADPHVAGGALYRLLKDSINLGMFDISERVYPFFEALAKSTYDIDFRAAATSCERAKERKSHENAVFPSWMGCGYFFAGRYLEHKKASPAQLAALFDAAVETMQHEIEIGAQFAQEPHHFLPFARKHLARALKNPSLAQIDLGNPVYPLTVVRRPTVDFAGKEVCLFVAYAPDGRLLPGALMLVKALVDAGLTVVVCCAVNKMETSIDIEGLNDAAAILKRKNGGYDFAVWAAALAEMPSVWSAARLFFVNDSILGPMHGFDQMMDRIRNSTADFLALTESYQIEHHSQSYFFVFQNKGLLSPEVRSFWRNVRVEKYKDDVIKKYEVALLGHVRNVARLEADVLFSHKVLFPDVDIEPIRRLNPTHHLWEHLIHFGFPFVKAELLHANPLRLNIDHWEPLIALHGGDVSLIKDHLRKIKSTRSDARFRGGNYRKWRLLRRTIGEDRFFDLREKIAKLRRRRRGGF